MAMVRWYPFGELARMREAMDQLWEDSWPRSLDADFTHSGEPALDVYQTPNELVLQAAVPGLRPEDVDVSITGDMLTIRGQVKEEKDVSQEDYLLKERRYGAFARTVHLPDMLKTDKAEAVFENGILTLTIPKAEEAKPKAINVRVKGMIESGKESRKAA